jgi:hypothetical protein
MAAAKEKEKEKEKKPIKTGASSGHIAKLKQSIFLRCLWTLRKREGFKRLKPGAKDLAFLHRM